MAGLQLGFRAAVVMFLAGAGSFACSTSRHPIPAAQKVAETRQALDPTCTNPADPGWTPRCLNPIAWYLAAPGNVTLDTGGTTISRWSDISGNNRHITQEVASAKPHFNASGWAGHQPTVTFDGGDLLRLDTWSETPAGTDTPLTVLAVVRPAAAVDADIAGWWDPNGNGYAWAGFKVADGRLVPDVGRTFGLAASQSFSGPHDVGNGRHTLAWRYFASSQTVELTVDGTSKTSSGMPPIGPLPQMPFIVGAGTLLPSRLFQGDMSELLVFNTTLSDADVQNFTGYARTEWDGLPTTGSNDPCTDANGQPTPTTTRCDDADPTTYGDHCSGRTCAGTVPPAGSPAELSPTAWYHAGAAEVALRDGGVETWFDRTAHHLDLSNGFYWGRPTLSANGWSSGKPTVTLAGHHLLFRNAWTGAPAGNDAPFTVLAVMRPTAIQTNGVTAWWSEIGAGRVGCDVKTSGSASMLDLFRVDYTSTIQEFTGSTDLATAKHVMAWRYSPGRMQLTRDGLTAQNTSLPVLGSLTPEMMLVGADSAFASTLLNAELAELVLIPRSINDTELANFDTYAQNEWGGLPISCTPSCSGKACDGDDGCGGTCECDSPCTANAQCSPGFTCSNGSCGSPCGSGTTDKVGCNIHLRFDGVVDAGDGTFVAVFGHNSTATTTFHPSTNVVSLDGTTVSDPQPPPPAYLPPGDHPGSFLPSFNAGQTISWTVDGESVSASQASTQLTKVQIGASGYGVDINGTIIVIKPDLDPYLVPPPTPGQAADPTIGLSEFPGMLTGELTVSPSGAAIYTVPIALAPGIAGMAPNLSLVYSSQRGAGLAGQGWDLTGLSMIHRCALTLAEDGAAHPVTLNNPVPSDDGVCLDGKRLFHMGQNYADGSERYELELEDFSDISLYQAPDDPTPDGTTFKVVTKSGQTRYYGLTYLARVTLPQPFGAIFSGEGRTTAIWLLEKVVDVWGNYWEIAYNDSHGTTGVGGHGTTDFQNRGILPTDIHYTGHLAGSSSNGATDEAEPFQTIHFTYEDRPDVRSGRLGTGVIARTQRLKSIDTGIGVYTLDYAQPSSPPTTDDLMLPSRLQTINYCPATGACALPLNFDWDGGGYGWAQDSNYRLPASIDRGSGSRFIDLDGDGRLDLLSYKEGGPPNAWRNTGTGWISAPGPWHPPVPLATVDSDGNPTNTMFADLDGDGVTDGMFIAGGPIETCPQSTTPCGQSSIQFVFNQIRMGNGWPVFYPWIRKSAEWAQSIVLGSNAQLIDMNGDGRADIVYFGANDNDALKVILTPVFDIAHPDTTPLQDSSAIYGGVTPIRDYELRDINRDGLPDLVGRYGTAASGKAYIQNGLVQPDHDPSHATTWTLGAVPANLPQDMQSTADFDGDGMYEVLEYGCKDTDGPPSTGCEVGAHIPFTERIAVSTGTGYGVLPSDDPRMSTLARFTPPTDDHRYRKEDYAFIPVDVNADGLADLVQRKLYLGQFPDSASGRLLFNTGTDFVTLNGATSWQADVEPNHLPVVPMQNRESGDPNTTFIDLDGDGLTDIASPGMSWHNTFRRPVIRAFPNGLATKSVPTYKVITTADALTGELADHPTYAETVPAVQPGSAFMITPVMVVASMAMDDGIGGTQTTDYEYRDLRASPNGRGPQGFGTVIATGPEDRSLHTRIQTTTQYLQAFPYTGLPQHVTRDLVNASTRSRLATVSSTTTDYCDAIPTSPYSCTPYSADPWTLTTGMTRFVRPTNVIDDSFLLSSTDLVAVDTLSIVSTFQHDMKGNPTQTTVTTQQGGETYEKKVVNVYGTADSAEERLGKVTLSTVTTRRVTPEDCVSTPTVHTTKYEYGEVSSFASPLTEGLMVGTLGGVPNFSWIISIT